MKALVTGAGSGIGRAISRELAKRGWDLVITGRNEEKLLETAGGLECEYGVGCRVILADLAKEEDCFRLYEEVRDENVDALINNAGVGVYGEFSETSLERELDLIRVNVVAVHILTKLFLRDMLRRKCGYILNVGSSAGFLAGPTFSSYYASKNYVVRLTQAIHEELRRKHSPVKISVLCPGPVKTEFNAKSDVKQEIAGGGISAQAAAAAGVDGMLKGKMIIIPGVGMKAVKVFSHFAGEELLTRIQYRIQSKKSGKGRQTN